MKTGIVRIVFFSVAILLALGSLHAQNFNDISNAIKQGNASTLASNFQSNVEITIKDATNTYSKSQAEMVLKNFFNSNQPRSFTIAHEGTSPEGSKYFIGNLSTTGGNYRVYVYAKSVSGAFSIQEIRIEQQ